MGIVRFTQKIPVRAVDTMLGRESTARPMTATMSTRAGDGTDRARQSTHTTGLVFPSHVTGGCYHAGIIQRLILKPKGEEIGIVGLGWHSFSHTYRSLLDETGAPIGVQHKLMRHSNVATTRNVYAIATLRAKQHANSKVVQMVMTQERPQEVERLAV